MHEKGRSGEHLAARLLEEKGYRVVARNYRSRRGEVDLVVCRGEDLVFVEVKTWDALPIEGLEQALGVRKRRRIADAAGRFLVQHPEYRDWRIRFDLVFLQGGGQGVRHFENAFDGVSGTW